MPTNQRKTTEYIVIGGGSAGSVMANRLSKDHQVTLLEAGPTDHSWDFRLHMPAALSEVLANDTYNWYYHTEPEAGLDDRELYCPRGRVLGGSSSINGMIYVRGNAEDFNRWGRCNGLEDWDYAHCLPYFKKSEHYTGEPSHYRGDTGPLHVRKSPANRALFTAWLEAGVEAGYRHSDDFNGEVQEGVGCFDATIKDGKRFSAARAYLHPIMNRKNLSIIKRATANKLLFENNRAVGVEYSIGSSQQRLYAEKEVIVCGGAINSPKLLLLSGIGPASELEALGIPVVQHLKGVGKNLQDHLEIYVQYECKKPVSLFPVLKWYRKPFVGMNWYLNQTGDGATNHFETGAFLRSGLDAGYPDLQFHFLPIAMNYDGKEKFPGHGFQIHVGPMKPTSRGSVTLKDANPDSAPGIQFNYNQTSEDREVMRRGIEIAREIANQPAFAELTGREVKPGNLDIDTFIRQHSESAYHPSCTCKMGFDEDAVVDNQGRVHGLENLRVVDASIMPEITNGNLNAPVIMMAEKISDEILGHTLEPI